MNEPMLRFKGFKDEWENKKLKDIANSIGGKPLEKYFNSDGKYKIISIGSYSENGKYIDQSIRVSYAPEIKNKIVPKNSLTMILNDKTQGKILGKVLLISSEDKYVVNQRSEIIIPNKKINSKFLYFYINSNIFHDKIISIAQGGTQIYLNYSSVVQLHLCIPSLSEQQKIGSFFEKLDQLIQLQSDKLEHLKITKKGYLQKMFIKRHSVNPNIRFKGFNKEWNKIKIKDLSSSISGNPLEKYFNTNGKYKIISIGSYGLDGNYVDQGIRINNIPKIEKKIVPKNSITMVLNDKTSGKMLGRVLLIDENNKYVINQRSEIIIPNKNINSKFLFFYFNGPIFHDKILSLSQGGTQVYLNYSSVEKIYLKVPSLKEQEKIGQFFSNLDQQINLQQQKLDNLKQQKKAYLQKMFI